jgi:hypothetical protein
MVSVFSAQAIVVASRPMRDVIRQPKTRSLRQRAVALLLVSSIVGTHTSVVFAQSEEERAGARAAATEGAQAFRDGKYADAADLFTRAESLVHAPPHLLYLARAQVKLGQFVKAQENFNKILRENLAANAPKAFHDAQTEAAKEIKDVESHIAYVKATVKGEGKNIKMTMDGALVPNALIGVQRPVDPGEHKFQASADGMTSDVVAVTVKEGGRQAVEITLKPGAAPPMPAAPPPSTPTPTAPTTPGEPAATPPSTTSSPTTVPDSSTNVSLSSSGGGGSGMRIAGFVGIGIGIVGFGAAGAFAAKAGGKHSDADNLFNSPTYNCAHPGPNNCSVGGNQRAQIQSLDDEANSAKKTANIGVIVGVVGVVGGGALLLLSMGGSKEKSSAKASAGGEASRPLTRPSVTPWVGLGSAGVSGSF